MKVKKSGVKLADPFEGPAIPLTVRIIPLDMENVSGEHASPAVEDEGRDVLTIFYAAAQEMAAEKTSPIPWNGEEGWHKFG